MAGNSGYSNVLTITAPPSSVTNVAVSVTGATSIRVTWTDGAGESSYRIQRTLFAQNSWSDVGTTAANATSFTDSTAVPGTEYEFRVVASNGSFDSLPSGSAYIELPSNVPPAAPASLTAAGISGRFAIQIAWLDVAHETSYRIERSPNGSTGWAQIGSVGQNVTTFTNEPVTSGVTYYYRVIAANPAGDSSPSPAASAVGPTVPLPTAPSNLHNTNPTETSITLAWNDNSTDETSFTIEQFMPDPYNEDPWWAQIGTVAPNVTSFTVTGLEVDVLYSFRVIAHNIAGASAPATLNDTQTAPTNTELRRVDAVNATRIDLQWYEAGGNTGYRIERSFNGHNGWATIATINYRYTTSYSDTTVAPQSSFYYRIFATSPVGESAPYNVMGATTPVSGTPDMPQGLVSTPISSTQINLTWTDGVGETGYRIERSANGTSGWSAIGTTAANVTSFSDTGLTAATNYYYRVIATNGVGDSSPSATANTFTFTTVPANLTATAVSTTRVNLTWGDVTGEWYYRLERSADGGNTWVIITYPSANVTSYSDLTASAGGTYSYRIRGVNSAGTSGPSNVATATTLPAAPATLNATIISDTRIDLAWSNVAGETGYKIERSTDGGSTWTQVATTAADVVAYSDTTVSGASTYSYRVRANNATGDGAYSPTATATTIPAAPTLSATPISATQVNLGWSDVAGETGYKVERSSNGGSTWTQIATTAANITTYSDTTASGGASYLYRVKASGAAGDSNPSNSVSVTTVPSAPSSLTATPINSTRIDLTWSDVAGETGYAVQRSSDGGSNWTTVGTTATDVTSLSDTTASPATSYLYRVIASNASGSSTPSPSASALTVPAAPSGLTPTPISATQVNLAWSDVSGETGYKVERSSDGGSNWLQIGTTAANVVSFSDTTAAAATSYLYRVKAGNATGDSAASASASVLTVPAAPAGLTATPISATQVNLAWSDVAGESGYKVDRSSDGGSNWTQIGTTSSNVTSYSDTLATGGTTYSYRVKANNATGDSAPSASASGTTVPAAPVSLTATPISATQVSLSWADVTGETGYKVERSSNGGSSWSQIGTTGANVITFSDTTASGGTAYLYRVKANNGTGDSAPSASASATTIPAAPTSLAATTISTTQVNLTWSDVTGETGYKVQRSSDGGANWTQIATTGANVTSYADASASAGSTYSYRVFANNATGDSAASNVASATTPTVAPATLSATAVSTSQINLSWSDVSGETGYKIERSGNGGANWTQIATPAANVTTYQDTALAAGTTYQYRVRATNAGGDSAYSPVATTTTIPPAPTGLTATAVSTSQINLSWNNMTGNTGYLIERSPDGSTGWTQVGSTAANVTSFSNTGLSQNTTYYYRVRATGASGNSAYSATASATTPQAPPAAPTNLVATAQSSTSINLTWTGVSNATGYRIERSTNGTTWSTVATVGNVTTYTNTGLTKKTKYYYRIVAYNSGGDSPYSNVATATTPVN